MSEEIRSTNKEITWLTSKRGGETEIIFTNVEYYIYPVSCLPIRDTSLANTTRKNFQVQRNAEYFRWNVADSRAFVDIEPIKLIRTPCTSPPVFHAERLHLIWNTHCGLQLFCLSLRAGIILAAIFLFCITKSQLCFRAHVGKSYRINDRRLKKVSICVARIYMVASGFMFRNINALSGKSNFCVRSSRRLECFLHRLQQHGSVGRKQMFKLPIGSTHADTHSNRYYSLVFSEATMVNDGAGFFFSTAIHISVKEEGDSHKLPLWWCSAETRWLQAASQPCPSSSSSLRSHSAPGSLTPPATVWAPSSSSAGYRPG